MNEHDGDLGQCNSDGVESTVAAIYAAFMDEQIEKRV